jgi:hypothetical protein
MTSGAPFGTWKIRLRAAFGLTSFKTRLLTHGFRLAMRQASRAGTSSFTFTKVGYDTRICYNKFGTTIL